MSVQIVHNGYPGKIVYEKPVILMNYSQVWEDEKRMFYSQPFPLTDIYVDLGWSHAIAINIAYMSLVLWGLWRQYRGQAVIIDKPS